MGSKTEVLTPVLPSATLLTPPPPDYCIPPDFLTPPKKLAHALPNRFQAMQRFMCKHVTCGDHVDVHVQVQAPTYESFKVLPSRKTRPP